MRVRVPWNFSTLNLQDENDAARKPTKHSNNLEKYVSRKEGNVLRPQKGLQIHVIY